MTDPRLGGGLGAARFVGAVAGFVFAAIGVTVIAFLWGSPSDEWDSPPLVFRVFGSLIALLFVAFGGTIGVSALRFKPGPMVGHVARGQGATGPDGPPAGHGAGRGSYRCPNCAAPLGTAADVSPSGDVKCAFCGRWFNVHREG